VTFAASRLAAVKPSASMAVSGRAKAMRADGIDVIDLGVGEPDFDTPTHIIDAAHAAARSGNTRYTPTDGAADLKLAVSEKFRRENKLDYDTSEIIICNGAKQVLFQALMATLEAGDEVILCAPHFDSYLSMIRVQGAQARVIKTTADNGFRLTPQALEEAITPQTRWLFLNMPSNPAGCTYSRSELAALGAVLERHPRVLILSDEIYEHIIFDGFEFISFTNACPNLRQRALIVNGVSKAYAMTGWRIGYGAGPAELISAMIKVQSQITSGASAISQAAALAALTGPQDKVGEFCAQFEHRRDTVVAGVDASQHLTLATPGGAFYAFIGCAALLGLRTPSGVTLQDDADVSAYLLEHGRVATVPGQVYGLSTFIRLSTATSNELLSEAMSRINNSIDQLQK